MGGKKRSRSRGQKKKKDKKKDSSSSGSSSSSSSSVSKEHRKKEKRKDKKESKRIEVKNEPKEQTTRAAEKVKKSPSIIRQRSPSPQKKKQKKNERSLSKKRQRSPSNKKEKKYKRDRSDSEKRQKKDKANAHKKRDRSDSEKSKKRNRSKSVDRKKERSTSRRKSRSRRRDKRTNLIGGSSKKQTRTARSLSRERYKEEQRREEEKEQREQEKREEEAQRKAEAEMQAQLEKQQVEMAELAAERKRELMRKAEQAARKEAGDLDALNVRKYRKDKVKDQLGYTNSENPFNDVNLTEKFVWKKRAEFLNAAGLYEKDNKKKAVHQVNNKVDEIKRVKKRRDERIIEQEQLEEHRLEREKELQMENFEDWDEKETEFALDMTIKKSELRMDQGREKPIDLVYRGMIIIDGEAVSDLTLLECAPHLFLPQMHEDDLKEMLTEVINFSKCDEKHKDLWHSLKVLTEDSIKVKEIRGSREKVAERQGIPNNIFADVNELLMNQEIYELRQTAKDVEAAMESDDCPDVKFMEAVRRQVPYYLSVKKLSIAHKKAQERAALLGTRRKADMNDSDDEDNAVRQILNNSAGELPMIPEDEEIDMALDSAKRQAERAWVPRPDIIRVGQHDEIVDEDIGEAELADEDGCFIPTATFQAFRAEEIIDHEDDVRNRARLREQIISRYHDNPDEDKGFNLWQKERAKGYKDGEANFNSAYSKDNAHGLINLELRAQDWDDKYKPRKPRFFNRVKTGFSWSKYNKSHYDMDNPPPKMVVGYRFNIFYPDLIDKVKGAPKYVVEKSDTIDTVILRFIAGPPYEDIAFKIVNKEWMINPRQGFRCVFDKGVLQLYFNVKRNWYKR